MRKHLSLLLLGPIAIALAGCDEFLAPQAAVTGGGGGPTIAQAQAVPYNGPKARIAVLNFEDRTGKGYGTFATGLDDMLVTELVNTDRYIVLERRQLGAVIAEQDLGEGGRVEPGTEAPAGQIEGAELLVTGVLSEFEPNYQGERLDLGLGSRKHPLNVVLQMRHSQLAIDLRVIDARTSRILAATTVTGRATDFGAGLGTFVGGGRTKLALGLSTFKNTPMEQAIRVCLAEAVSFVAARTPPVYYHYDANGQPVPPGTVLAPPPPLGPPAGPPEPIAPAPPTPSPQPPQPGQVTPGRLLPERVYVALDRVRVYERPEPISKHVATLDRGTRLHVLGEESDWYAVQLPDGRSAWILRALTDLAPPQ